MATHLHRGDGTTYSVEVEQVEVTSIGPRVDPTWHYIDAAGHEHTAAAMFVVDVLDDPDGPPYYVDEDGEEYNAPMHLECPACGEHITPAMIGPSPFRHFIPGQYRYYRDGVEITKDEYTAATAGWKG